MSTQTEIEEIKTDNLLVKVTREANCNVKLEIDVNPEGTKAAYIKAIKTINKEISIPGFRKGKAPEHLIIQQFGKHVNREWHDILANTAFHEYLSKTHAFPFSKQKAVKRAEVKSASAENGSKIFIEYEAKPIIPDVDYSILKLKAVERSPVILKDIEDTIHQIQLRNAEWTPITDRPVQEGDFVDLDINTLESPPRTICNNMRFEVAPGKMGAWMRNLILGRSLQESVEGMSEKDENLTPEQLAQFTPTMCRITILAINTAKLPQLDEHLIQKLGVKTEEELRQRIESDLNRQADESVQDRLRAQVEAILLENYQFEIPFSLIEAQSKNMIQHRLNELNKQKSNLQNDEYTERKNYIIADVLLELNRSYRLFFLTNKIAEQNDIKVYEKDIMNEMMLQMTIPSEQAIINSSMEADEMRSRLFVNIQSHKTLDFLVSKATIEKE